MTRAVSADHILFDECISAFRREQENIPFPFEGESCAYIMTSFKLTHPWELGICTLTPSIEVRLPIAYASFISKVNTPKWVGTHHPHCFGVALSTILSFITGKVCKSTRSSFNLSRKPQLLDDDYYRLALENPVLTAGSGYIKTTLSEENLSIFEDEVRQFIEKLRKVDYKKYRIVMQAIRLVYLSMSNKRDDFGLAYSLIVAAIEAVSQTAINEKVFKKKHPSENEWKKKSESDNDFSKLFALYKESRSQNKHLKERYIEFILKYAPIENWENYVPNSREEFQKHIPSLFEKSLIGKYPNELDKEQIKNILSDSYTHRSCFIHRGEQPPHNDPLPHSRFFQEYREYKDGTFTEGILPNYELLLGLGKESIKNWLYS